MSIAQKLRFVGVRGYRYRMPLKRPYGTARGVTKAATNFVIVIAAEHSGASIEGLGECQPRHALTGDGDRRGNAAWEFLDVAARQLTGRAISVEDRGQAVDSVREIMTELDGLARQHAPDGNRDRPFRGTLLGVEVAMLDAAARALNLQVSELLGKKRDTIGISISTISSKVTLDAVGENVIRQKRFPMTRVKGVGDLDYDWQLLETVVQANRSVGREKTVWMDINEALDLNTAYVFVDGVVERMSAGLLTGSVVLEGILPKAQVTDLPLLQRRADEASRAASSETRLDLRIMPDEGMWDASDLARVNAAGGCRALNIKAPKAGGLLASLDLAEAAVAADPDIHVSIGGMLGTSDITAWSLHNLARALPRVDYLTTVPPSNVEERICEPLARYHERGSNIVAGQTTSGIGTRLVMDKLAPYIDRSFDTSTASLAANAADSPPATARAEATTAGGGLSRLSGRELESYLLEREALALGLCCLRLGRTTFLAGPTSERVGDIGFHRTASTKTSRVARDILADRRYLGAVLRDEGIPFGERRRGARYHAFVLDSRTISLVRRGGGTTVAVLEEAHPEVLDLAVRALTAIPGLGHADVELAIRDHRSPIADQPAHVVNMDPAPRLNLHEPGEARPRGTLARILVREHVGRGQHPASANARVTARVSLIGTATARRAGKLLEQLSTELTLVVRETGVGDTDQVFATVEGNIEDVAAVSVLAVTGPHAPETVEITPISGAERNRPGVEK